MTQFRYTLFFAVSLLFSETPPANAGELGATIQAAIQKVAPSVVRINSVGRPDPSGRVSSRVTTGIVVSSDGEVVTSSFGFGKGIAATFVENNEGERYAAQVVAQDHVRKLVLLKTDAKDLPVPEWMTEDLAVGAWAIACGRFYASKLPSASLGVISARNRIHRMALQTDAKVSPVNYGGPLIGMDGRVAGILVPLAPLSEMNGVEWYDSGIGFAIPSRDLLKTVHALKDGRDRQHGLLGISLNTNNPLSTNVVVGAVLPGSPAAKAGVAPDDRIVAVNGESIDRAGSLQRILGSAHSGDQLELTVRRADTDIVTSAVLVSEIAGPPRGWLGLVPLAAAGTEDSKGGVRVGVIDGSPARNAGLPSTCVITRIDENETEDFDAIRSTLHGIVLNRPYEIRYAVEPDLNTVKSVTVTAATIPDELPSENVLEMLTTLRGNEKTEWTQSVTDLNEDTHLWMYAPKVSNRESETGCLVFIADGEPAKDTLVSRWQSICEEYNLIVAVVYRDYSLPLSDVKIILKSVSDISQSHSIDPDRLVIHAVSSTGPLAARMLLNPRLAAIRLAVFRDSRPWTEDLPADSLRAKQPALLILSATHDSQEAALLSTAGESLQRMGASVKILRVDELNDEQQALEVARWLIVQKVR